MEVRFVSQPYDNSSNLMGFIQEESVKSEFQELTICVAWAKRSGIEIVKPALEEFRARGGNITMILGIGEGGATKQGLRLAFELSTSSYVFHDKRGPTFHPKIYLLKGSEKSKLFVGSNNLTAGGAYYNYEAATITTLVNSQIEDANLLTEVESYLNKLQADSNLCVPLSPTVINDLVSNPRYRIADEDNSWRNRIRDLTALEADIVEDVDEVVTPPHALLEIFGPSIHPLASRPRKRREKGAKPPVKAHPPGVVHPTKVAKRGALVFETWTKKLNATDAQHPPKRSSAVTGNARLSQAGNSIDHKSYFREIFFGRENWVSAGSGDPAYEKCLVEFDVVIHGKSIGLTPFRIDHNSARIADQNNVPTVLKWGVMGNYMRSNNHVNEWLTLTAFADGTYQMLITKDDPRNPT